MKINSPKQAYIQEALKKQNKKQNLNKKLTSMSPLGMPSNSEGLIQPSTTSHPPKFTAFTLESPANPSTWETNKNNIRKPVSIFKNQLEKSNKLELI